MYKSKNSKGLILFLILVILLSFSLVSNASEKNLKFGLIVPTLAHGWQSLNWNYTKSACEELGVELVALSGNDNSDKQISDLQSLISSGVDGLLLDPIVAALGVKMVEMANEAGIPAIFFDREPDAKVGGQYISFVGPDSIEGGYRLGKWLFDNGCKKIIEIDGMPGSAPAAERAEGLMKALAEYKDVEIVSKQAADWDMIKGMNVAQDLLTANPDVDGIWAANDMMGMGALSAVEKMGFNKIKIASIDVDPDAVQKIIGGSQLKITIGAHYICGAISAILMYDYLKGIEIPGRVEFSMLAVDSSNAEKFMRVNEKSALLAGKAKILSKFENPNAPDNRWQNVLNLDDIDL